MSRAALAAAAVLVSGSCGSAAPPASCGDDLQGVYIAPGGARWMILDNRRDALPTLEAYPLFSDAADVVAPPGVVVAPRVIDLAVSGAGSGAKLAGDVLRRYTRGGDHCDVRAPVHVTACTSAGLELVLADPSAPRAFAPCAFPAAEPSRRERWRRD